VGPAPARLTENRNFTWESIRPLIAYLKGKLIRKHDDRVVIDVSGVGYEVVLPQFVRRTFDPRPEGDEVELEIYYHASERQIRPLLLGFNHFHEKLFFEKIIQVEDVGPVKAARAMVLSVSTIARAIEAEDVRVLRGLPGIGERTANKMIATLRGRCVEEALLLDEGFDQAAASVPATQVDLKRDALDILLSLGHRRTEAEAKVDSALVAKPEISDIQELIREVYRQEAKTS
jgi:Holliday junction DNA helicase RuvA